ncbi:GntR family transcriptional regulator [Variovorax paradoxus]|jgi:DNA-binding GntR family transcriptional regulator|uniref:GntR family transcriptional regulator n=1 Tax=Variovorax paradoxus TaxID=34073 RepID=UPI003AAB1547
MVNRIQNSVESSPDFIEQVYQRLLESISLGEMKPGERIRQSVLADRLGVSRQPVSHALQLLKHQGLVRDAGKQGMEVTPVDPDYVIQLYDARTSLESKAAALAASRVRDGIVGIAEVRALQDVLAEGQYTVAEGPLGKAGVATLTQADARFHSAIYRLSGNQVIKHMMEGQWPHLMRSMMAVLDDPTDRNVPSRAWSEHGLIAESIVAGDVENAGLRATSHMKRAGADLARRLSASQTVAVRADVGRPSKQPADELAKA